MLCVLTLLSGRQVALSQPIDTGDSVKVSLVTFYPGAKAFNIFGHSELRVQQGPQDWYFNYGVFDFSAPGFMWRFVLGETDYMCMAVPQRFATQGMEGRRMVEQELNLTQEQAREIRDFLTNNAMPANRVYRYQYLSDNLLNPSTRHHRECTRFIFTLWHSNRFCHLS